MTVRRVILAVLAAWPVVVFGAGPADAQRVVACRDRSGAIVPCESGGGGSGGGADYSGGVGALGYQLGYGIGLFLRSLMEDNTDYEAIAAEQARQQQIQAEARERQRAERAAQEARRAEDQRRRQEEFSQGQAQLLGMIRPLGTTAGAARAPQPPPPSPVLAPRQLDTSSGGALRQLQTAAQDTRDVGGSTPEAQHEAASRAFDSGGAPALPGGPLMTVRGVPPPPETAPPPPTPIAAAAPDPLLRPMTLDQRAMIAEGRRARQKLDSLRERRARGEIDADTFEREEVPIKNAINALARRFAEAIGPVNDAPAASSPAPAPRTAPAAAAGGPRLAAAGGDVVGSCYLVEPATTGCLEIRNPSTERLRVYVHEVPGVFCTIEAGSMCSRPVSAGVYHAFAQRDDGRRTTMVVLDLGPHGLRWQAEF